MRILLIEDEPHLAAAVRDHLIADGHAVDWTDCLADANAALSTVEYAIVLLDLHLPDGSGYEFLRSARQQGVTTPVIVLSARDQISDRIKGLDLGADDYLVKPFDLDELVARIAAINRRYGQSSAPTTRIGGLQIDHTARRIWRDGAEIRLTQREWAVLDSLTRRANAVVSKSQLEEALYAFGDEVESNAIEAHISRIRAKLGPDVIQTQRGVGYCIKQ